MTILRTQSLPRLIAEFRQDISGQFALIFALSVASIVMCVGVAIDYTSATSAQNKAQHVLDASVMAAARAYQLNPDKRDAKKVARKSFKEHCYTFRCDKKKLPKYRIVDSGAEGFEVSAEYFGAWTPAFMQALGYDSVAFKNEAVVGYSEGETHQEIHFVLDWSASLGIAATVSEQQRLKDLTEPFTEKWMSGAEDGCAFACHLDESFIKPEVNGVVVNTYDFARANSINLVEDIVTSAVDSVVEDIFSTGTVTTKVGMYAISDRLARAKSSTNQPFSASDALNSLSMDRYGTRFDIGMPDLTNQLGMQGSGIDAQDPIKSIILVTDGLNNNYGGGVKTSAFSDDYCAGLKANGINVAVLHIPYPDLLGQPWYEYYAKPHLEEIPEALQSCASEGLYFDVEHAHEIPSALGVIASTVSETEKQELAFRK